MYFRNNGNKLWNYKMIRMEIYNCKFKIQMLNRCQEMWMNRLCKLWKVNLENWQISQV